ncbi:hypothetical protein ALC56_06974, partial [Trachymyrmex septentrionalis]
SDNMEHDLIEQATQLNTREEYVAWEQRCDEFMESLEEQSHAKCLRLSIGKRQSVITCIARLESLKDSVRERYVHVGAGYGLPWREIETAFESRILTGAVINSNHIEPRRFLEDAREIMLERVRDAVERHGSAKVNTALNGEFATKDKRDIKNINIKNSEIYRCIDLCEWYEQHIIEPTLTSLEEFQERDSGWALSRILNLVVNVNKLNPMRAGCYFEVPREIIIKKAVINVSTMDNACFAWSVVAALYRAKSHVDRKSSYPHYTAVLNLAGIEFPITFKDISKFENLNNISINVYSIENKRASHSSSTPTWSAFYGRWNPIGKMRRRTHINDIFSIGYYLRCSYDDALSSYQFRRDKDSYEGRVDVLPITKEKYISFTKHVDSS